MDPRFSTVLLPLFLSSRTVRAWTAPPWRAARCHASCIIGPPPSSLAPTSLSVLDGVVEGGAMDMRVSDTAVILAGLSVPVLGGAALAFNALADTEGSGDEAERALGPESRPTTPAGGPSWPVTVISGEIDPAPAAPAELDEATRQLEAARELLEAEKVRRREVEAKLADARDAGAERGARIAEDQLTAVARAEERLADAKARLRAEAAKKEGAEAALARAAAAKGELEDECARERDAKGEIRWELERARGELRSTEARRARADLLREAAEARASRAEAQLEDAGRSLTTAMAEAESRLSDAEVRLHDEAARREDAEAALVSASEANRELEDKFELEQDAKGKAWRELQRAREEAALAETKLEKAGMRLEASEARVSHAEAELREERGSLRKLGRRMWSLSKQRVRKRFRQE